MKKLTLTDDTNGYNLSYEISSDSGIDDLIECFANILVGASFSPELVKERLNI
jgi:hypothetical protein